jgi:hypothetical protein
MPTPRVQRVTVDTLRKAIPPQGRRLALICPSCGASYSAHAGDYFMRRDDEPFRCACPRRPYLRLGYFVRTFHEVTV